MEPIKILEYLLPDGTSPFYKWLHHDVRDLFFRGRIRQRLARVRAGNFGNCRPVGKGVQEIKLDMGPGYRIYFGRRGSEIIILLCAGNKGTQVKDICLAIEYWEDYQRREKS
ncbi:MAG: type II toxin-antitoxin system RelE/ParE family toxin [Candidatus Firestonebacteria bacterium]|nr:type II toxin-antitoxin system RelE/ParE family toxin [Candidatus Firestonebacteria bacterium]